MSEIMTNFRAVDMPGGAKTAEVAAPKKVAAKKPAAPKVEPVVVEEPVAVVEAEEPAAE